jgi:hypothetical protein
MLIACRALAAGTRMQGLTPCTEDEIPKEEFGLLGTQADMDARLALARKHTPLLEADLRKARDFVYKKGYSVKYQGVEQLLKSKSLTLTEVFIHFLCPPSRAHLHITECVLALGSFWP